MSTNIRFPNITGKTEAEQIAQIKSYLHQLVQQLNWILTSEMYAEAPVTAERSEEQRLKDLGEFCVRINAKMEANNTGLSVDEKGILLAGRYVYWHDNGGGTHSLVGYDYGVPRITNLKATRCDANRIPTPNGMYALVEFDWACDFNVTDIDIERTWDGGSSASNYSVSGKSGHYSSRLGGNSLSTDTAYTYTVSITVGENTSSVSVVVPATIGNNEILTGGE